MNNRRPPRVEDTYCPDCGHTTIHVVKTNGPTLKDERAGRVNPTTDIAFDRNGPVAIGGHVARYGGRRRRLPFRPTGRSGRPTAGVRPVTDVDVVARLLEFDGWPVQYTECVAAHTDRYRRRPDVDRHRWLPQ